MRSVPRLLNLRVHHRDIERFFVYLSILWQFHGSAAETLAKKTATAIMHNIRTLFLTWDIEISSLIALRCSDAWSRDKPRHRANLVILRDKNSVLMLCIIVVAVSFGQGSIWLNCTKKNYFAVVVVSRSAVVIRNFSASHFERNFQKLKIANSSPWASSLFSSFDLLFAKLEALFFLSVHLRLSS